ncbi:unnamed protein product, partial [Effrenium voratum]
DEAQPQQQRGQRLRDEVSSLGTVFVKLAQTMATRSDLVTKELGRELRVLQDSMGRFPDEVALETIREARSGPRVRGGALELAALWRARLA